MDSKEQLNELMEEAQQIKQKYFGDDINFYYTGDYFPALSVTGPRCSLNCKHCNRILIERLTPVLEPRKLVEECMRLDARGATGVLITGGCDLEGRVPLDNYLDAIREIKNETNLVLIAHTGLIDYEAARDLRKSGVEGVCVDVVGSEKVTAEIYGVPFKPMDYINTLKSLERARLDNISPHICVGLFYGKLSHEFKALDIVSVIKPSNVVIIGLMNLDGSMMEDVRIKAADVGRVLAQARIKYQKTFISLGCARGKGEVRAKIDEYACEAGVNNIALPTPRAYVKARELGLKINEYKSCCSVLPSRLG